VGAKVSQKVQRDNLSVCKSELVSDLKVLKIVSLFAIKSPEIIFLMELDILKMF